MQEALHFCNRYLMLKVLATCPSQTGPVQEQASRVPIHKNKNKVTNKGRKLQMPSIKNVNRDKSEPKSEVEIIVKKEKPKNRNNKFEGPLKNLKTQRQRKLQIQVQQQSTYVPITTIMNAFNILPENRKNEPNYTNFKSFSPIDSNMGNYQTAQKPISSFNYNPDSSKLSYQKFESNTLGDQFRNPNFRLNPSHSEYFNTRRQISFLPETQFNQYHIPQSRSRSKSPLDHYQSSSNLFRNDSFIKQNVSKSKKKKKGERQFYMPLSISSVPQNTQIGRVTSTNNLLMKMERQILEQNFTIPVKKQPENDREKQRYDQTRFQTKGKNRNVKEIDQFSQLQLDNAVVEGLSFVSSMSGASKLFNINIKS